MPRASGRTPRCSVYDDYFDRNGLNVLLFSMICSEVAESRAMSLDIKKIADRLQNWKGRKEFEDTSKENWAVFAMVMNLHVLKYFIKGYVVKVSSG